MLQRPQETYELTAAERRDVREAMLNVHYRSLGRQWEQQGPPTVLLPPEMQLMDLRAALERLKSTGPFWRDAMWRVIRSMPPRGDPEADHRQANTSVKAPGEDDTTAMTAALIGLDGLEVLAAADAGGEV